MKRRASAIPQWAEQDWELLALLAQFDDDMEFNAALDGLYASVSDEWRRSEKRVLQSSDRFLPRMVRLAAAVVRTRARFERGGRAHGNVVEARLTPAGLWVEAQLNQRGRYYDLNGCRTDSLWELTRNPKLPRHAVPR